MAAIKLPISEIRSIDNSNKAYPFEAKGYGDAGHSYSRPQPRSRSRPRPKTAIKIVIKKRGRGAPKKRKPTRKGRGDIGYAIDPATEQARQAQFVASMGGKANMPGYSTGPGGIPTLAAMPGYGGIFSSGIPSSAMPNGITGKQSM